MAARFASYLKNPYLVLLLLWLFAAMIINPIGEFPINDDWAYSKNVYNLSVQHKFVVDPWPAMNLFSQTIYGTLVCKIFGFSFTVLRFSILILAIISSMVLYKIILRLSNQQQELSLLITIGFCFSTLFCSMSFTFMTDIFFLSFVVFAIYQIQLYHINRRLIHYFLFILFCVIAVLNRQHGVLIPLLISGVVFYHHKISLKSFLMMSAPMVLTWLAHDKYRHYLTYYGVSNNLQNTDRLWKYLESAPFQEIHAHAGDLFLTTGWMIMPLILILTLTQFPKISRSNMIIITICTLLAVLLVWQDWPLYPQGNVSLGFEIGPRVIKFDPALYSPSYLGWWPKVARIIAFLSATLCLIYILTKFIQPKVKKEFKTVYLPFLLVLGAYFIFVSLNEAYLDRYALPLACLILILLIPNEKATLTSGRKWIVYPIIFLTFLTTVIENRDFFNWQKKRWEAIEYLHQKKLGPDKIDGGFEYNGWHAKTPVFSEAPKSWWWIMDDEYIISHTPLKKYGIEKLFINPRWMPVGADTIYVLKREKMPEQH